MQVSGYILHHRRFTPWGMSPQRCTGGWVGQSNWLACCDKGKIICPSENRTKVLLSFSAIFRVCYLVLSFLVFV
jgi:hypothetical protein